MCSSDLVSIVVTGATLDPVLPPIEGAVFTSPSCPGVSLTSDHDGKMSGRVSADSPLFGRFEAKGWAQTLIPEQRFTADTSVAVTLPPSLLGAIIPGFGPTVPAIFVAAFPPPAQPDAGADAGDVDAEANDAGPPANPACAKLDGITVTVDGHPEAKVAYFSNDTVPVPVDGATATTPGGRLAITSLSATPDELVTLTATKPGCTVTFVKGSTTGRLPLEPGWITIAGAYLGG